MASHEFRIESDSPAAPDMLFWSIVGHEALSRPSVYEVSVLSKSRNLSASDVLGRAFDVVIEFLDMDGGKHERHCRGHAARFTRLGSVGRFFEYRIVLRSWFWLLTKRFNSRILQEQSVLEVFDAVVDDSPVGRVKKFKADKVIGTHKPRRYCVQFQESDYKFLSRLLEAEGIYYWFDAHEAPGTMMLADASAVAHDKLPAAGTLDFMPEGAGEARHAEIYRWLSARQFDTGKHAARDSDFKAINKKLGADINVADDHELADLEHFEFPGSYFSAEDAEESARTRGDELHARRDRHWALTPWPDVAAGRSFSFRGDPDGVRDGDYTIAACTFVASHPGYEAIGADEVARPMGHALRHLLADDAVNVDTLDVLDALIAGTPELQGETRGTSAFLITALPAAAPFRPPRLTPRALMPGPQSAIVVGPEGDELHVDTHGRVKVHFHWDRYDQSNERSTAWVRVSQPWAGKGWGGYFIPRIGQEVIVDFLNGDPDRPIIVGRVYNDDQNIPYDSPTQSGFKTRSTPDGGVENFNEIMFEDKKGEELLKVHAEKNMSTSVENDDSTLVGNDQALEVRRHRTVRVVGHETHTVDKHQINTILSYQTNTITKNLTTTVTKGDWNMTVQTGNAGVQVQSGKLGISAKAGTAIETTAGPTTVNTPAGPTTVMAGAGLTIETTGTAKYTTHGPRSDATDAAHSILANQVKIGANTSIDITAVGAINATSVSSNTTVLGSNSSGYIGINSEANLGVARSFFGGVAINSFGGLNSSTSLAVELNAAVSASFGFSGFDFSSAGLDMQQNGIELHMGGAVMAANFVAAGAAGFLSGFFGMSDTLATLDQYKAAEQQIADLMKDAEAAKMDSLTQRLSELRDLSAMRRRQLSLLDPAGTPDAPRGSPSEVADRLGESKGAPTSGGMKGAPALPAALPSATGETVPSNKQAPSSTGSKAPLSNSGPASAGGKGDGSGGPHSKAAEPGVSDNKGGMPPPNGGKNGGPQGNPF